MKKIIILKSKHRNLFCSKRSFTLIEITISLLILAIGLLGLLALFPVGFDASKRAGDITSAGILAQYYIEDSKRIGYSGVTNQRGLSSNSYFAYDVKVTIPAPPKNYKVVKVTIFWPAPSDPSAVNLSTWADQSHYLHDVTTFITKY